MDVLEDSNSEPDESEIEVAKKFTPSQK